MFLYPSIAPFQTNIFFNFLQRQHTPELPSDTLAFGGNVFGLRPMGQQILDPSIGPPYACCVQVSLGYESTWKSGINMKDH